MQSSIGENRFTLAGLAAILLWSTTIAFSRSLTEQLGTFTAASLIYLAAGLFGIGYAAIPKNGGIQTMTRLPKAYLLGCGLLFIAYIVSIYLAIGFASNRSQVLAVGLINYLWPGLSLVFSIPILNKKAQPWLFLGILLALAGVWLASSSTLESESSLAVLIREGSLLSYGFAFIAAVSWGLYSTLSRRWGGNNDAGAVPLFLLASGIFLAFLRLANPETSVWGWSAGFELAYMALFPGMIAYVLWDLAVRKGKIILVASLSYLTPLLSTLVSALVLDVIPGPTIWAGAGLVVIGALICKNSISDP